MATKFRLGGSVVPCLWCLNLSLKFPAAEAIAALDVVILGATASLLLKRLPSEEPTEDCDGDWDKRWGELPTVLNRVLSSSVETAGRA